MLGAIFYVKLRKARRWNYQRIYQDGALEFNAWRPLPCRSKTGASLK